ncbi:dihydrolipoyl dehydrogenase [Kineobactrum sediminis]|uniref:Dihydrolipoyl dehydrogenase n=2 Tax=Kineobactrum sediminis TaxID=1905677 RepID=A0A2N5Y1J9_9GAMM|nr:dihydrolipoyl dehydrogenase [Kineobactrum sediminis]
MDKRTVDVAIIGAGTAGLTAYNAARKHTDKLLLIEAGPFGTTCARVGCMPSKLLIAAADNAHGMVHSHLFGIEVKEWQVNGRRVMERLRRERDRFVSSVLDSIRDLPEHHKIQGSARFIAPGRLAVGDDIEVDAARIVIATGSSPDIPELMRAAGQRLLLNDSLFELPSLPESIAVFGPGVVGLELGQALSRLGVDVRMFGKGGELAGIADDDIRDYADRCFNEEFYLDTDAAVDDIQGSDHGVSITYEHRQKGLITEHFDYLLAATGRSPNLAGLDLENSGLTIEEDIPVTDPWTLRCGDSAVFLVGDANQLAPVLHEAAFEGRLAGDNAGRYPDVRQRERLVPFSVVFTSPQIARIGILVPELQPSEQARYRTGTFSFENQGRSRVMDRNRGMVKLYGERGSCIFAGAELFGPAAEHLAHLLAWAAQTRMTVTAMLSMPFYHPVIEEGLRTALRDLNYHLNKAPPLVDDCLECGPGG